MPVIAHHGLLLSGGDPFWSNVKILTSFDGVDASTSMIDSSPIARTMTANGNAQLDTAQSKFGGSSLLLDGTGDWVSTVNAADLHVAALDFTAECWVRRNAIGAIHTICNKRDATAGEEFTFAVNSTNVLIGQVYNAGSPLITLNGTNSLAANVWYHVAMVRSGGTAYLFKDGVVEGSGSIAGTAESNVEPFKIGRDGFNTGRDFNGWIDEFRFTLGVGRYTAAFDPPIAPFPRG